MANSNGDLKLIATLDENSSEAEIIKAIKILNGRLKGNGNAKIKLDADLDIKSVQNAIKKLETFLNSKNISVNTKNSIVSLQKEADAMLEIVNSANKASKEKLKFANANKKVAETANNTSGKIKSEKDAFQSLDNIDDIMQNINLQGKIGNSVFQQFGNTLRDAFYAFTAANLLQDAIYEVIDGGKEAVKTVKDLNDAAVSLRMATGDSYKTVKQLMNDYNAMAQELGALTTSVSEAADEWLRQGHSVEDSNILIKDSMMLSKISNLESAESTKYLTSAMQGYKVAVEDVVGIVDKLSAVDLESATDAAGLAEAMSRTAEGAQIAGVSMDRLLGMIATVGEVTQKSMSSIGESYKTVFSRMRDIKDNKLSVVGEDGEIEDLSNVEIVLNSLNIKLRDSNLEFRNFQDVLDDVAKSWNSYSSVQKAAIAKAFSGVRQQENFLVMMENWDKVIKYTDIAANSDGTSTEKFGYYLESLEAKTNSLKASLENLASTTVSDELYGSVLDTTKAIVDMTAETGILKGTLVGLGTAGSIYAFQQLAGYLKNATQEFSNFGQALSITTNGQVGISELQNLINLTGGLTQSQTRLLLSTNNLTDAQKVAIIMNQRLAQGLPQITEAEALQQLQTMGVATAQNTATGTTISLSSAMRGLWSTLLANPLVLVTTAVSAGVMVWNKYKQIQEEVRQKSVELTNSYKEQQTSLDSQIEKYKELKETLDNGNLSTDETRSIKEQLLEIQKSLIESYGNEASNIDLVNGKYKEQLGLLGELSKEKATEYVTENRDAFNDAKNALKKINTYNIGAITWNSHAPQTEEQKRLVEYLDTYSDLLELIETGSKGQGIETKSVNLLVKANIEDADELMHQLYVDIEKYGKENAIDVSGLLEGISIQLKKTMTDDLEEYKTIYDEFMKAEIVRNDTLRPLYQESIKAVEDYNNALSTGEGVEEAKSNLDYIQQSVQNVTGELEGSQDVFDGIYDGINKDAEAAYNLGQAFANDKTVQSYAEQLRGLQDVDLQAINFDSKIDQPGKKAFTSLMDYLGYTEDQAQSLIDKLVELGYVQGDIQDSVPDIPEIEFPTISKTISDLEDLNKELDNLGTAIANIDTDGKFDLGDLDSIADYFLGLEDIPYDIEAVNNALKSLGDGNASLEEQTDSINTLADQYLKTSGILDTLTQDNAELIKLQLQRMGIVNAEEIVEATLNGTLQDQAQLENILAQYKSIVTGETLTLANVTAQEIQNLIAEGKITNDTANQMAILAIKKQLVNGNTLNTSADINNLISLCQMLGATTTALEKYNQVKNGANGMPQYVIDKYKEAAERELKNAINTGEKALKATYTQVPKAIYNGGANVQKALDDANKSASSSAKETEDTYEELFDFFERRIEVLNDALDLLKSNLENVVGADAKNTLIDAQIGINKESINNYTDALAMYTQKANEALAKIPAEFQSKIVDGSVSMTDFIGSGNEDLVDAINEYKDWAGKISDCKKELADLKQALEDLELDKFNNIVDDFTNQFDIRDNSKDLINKQIDLFKEAGQMIGKGFYEGLIKESEGQLSILQQEKEKLVTQLNSALDSGNVEVGSEAWLSMIDSLNEVDASILDCKKDIEEFNNSIQELHWEVVERIQKNFDGISDEIKNIIGLIDEVDVSDAEGIWSKEGLTQLGLYAQEYEKAIYAANMYGEEIEQLNQAYIRGEYSATEYRDKLIELKNAQWDEINASESAKDSIMDLNKSRIDIMVKAIEEEIDVMKELIDSKKEALDIEQELYEYKKSISEKSKSVTDLEKQIAATENDNTQKGIALRKKLEAELVEAKQDLADYEYSHSIDVQKDALDQQYEDFETEKNAEIEKLEATLDDMEAVISASFELVKEKALVIGTEINNIAQVHGISISNEITSAWSKGADAIAYYGDTLNVGTSSFVSNLTTMKDSVYYLQNQADITSSSLANMYNTNSQALLNNLTSAYYSLSNTNAVTQALGNSLINTLTRGYDTNSLVNSIKNVGDSASNAAKQVSDLMNALAGQPTSNDEQWKVYSNGKEVYTASSQSAAQSYIVAEQGKKKGNSGNYTIRKAAKGGIITKEDSGFLDPIARSVGEDHIIAAKDGESILTQVQTEEFMKLIPNMENFNKIIPNIIPDINTMVSPNAVKPNSPTVQIHYDNLVQVQGDVNNSNIRQMEQIVDNAITKQFNIFNTQLRKAGVR